MVDHFGGSWGHERLSKYGKLVGSAELAALSEQVGTTLYFVTFVFM